MDALVVLVGVFVMLDVAAWRHGADSRVDRHSPSPEHRNDRYWWPDG